MNARRSKKAPDAGSTMPASSTSGFPDDVADSPDDLPTTDDQSDFQRMTEPESLSSDMKGTATSVGRAVREQVEQFSSEIGQELSKTAEGQKQRGIEAMGAFARAVDTAATELEGQSPLVARYVRDAAQRMEGLSKNIGGRNVQELIENATSLARARPALFFAGVVCAGFALSRFVKSSATHDRSAALPNMEP